MVAARTAGAKRFIEVVCSPRSTRIGETSGSTRASSRAVRYDTTTPTPSGRPTSSRAAAASASHSGRVLRRSSDSDFTRDTIRYARKGWAASFGRPEGYTSSVSHDDAATAVVAVLGMGAGIYNVVDDEPLRRREYFDALAESLGVPPPIPPPLWVGALDGIGGKPSRIAATLNREAPSEIRAWAPKYPSVREGYRAVVAQMERARG